jgi:hypothetical protein
LKSKNKKQNSNPNEGLLFFHLRKNDMIRNMIKYHVNTENKVVRKYSIKEIFAENWDAFVAEM